MNKLRIRQKQLDKLNSKKRATVKKRNKLVVKQYLLPGETYRSVAKSYDISYEWVRIIVTAALDGKGTQIKKKLFQFSPKFKCIACGDAITTAALSRSQGKGYFRCNKISCHKFLLKYDLRQECTCEACGKGFFKFRNWTNTDYKGIFCSVLCYIGSGGPGWAKDKGLNDGATEATK